MVEVFDDVRHHSQSFLGLLQRNPYQGVEKYRFDLRYQSVFIQHLRQLVAVVLPKLIEQGRHGFFVSNEIDKEEMRLLPQGLQHNVQTVVQLQLLHHPERAQERPVDMVVLVLLVGEQGIAAGIVERVRVSGLLVLAQLAGLEVHHRHTVGIGSYPQLVVGVDGEGMHIALREDVLMGIGHKAALPGRVAHESAVVAAYPDAPFLVFTETRDDMAREAVVDGEAVEALAHRRDVANTAVERAYPLATLVVGGEGIDETVVELHPLAGLGVEAHQTVVAADGDAVVGLFVERMDMPSHLGQLRMEHLLEPPVVVHEQESLLPRAQPQAAVAGLQHAQRGRRRRIADADGLETVVQAVELLQHGHAPVGDGPYLVAVVDIYLGHRVAGCLDVVLS